MTTPPNEYALLLRERGISLRPLGVHEIALRQDDALAAAELLAKASVPILGGDVYFMNGKDIELAFENWHSDPRPGETRDRFIGRSCAETQEYIKKFPPSDAIALFSLVIDDL